MQWKMNIEQLVAGTKGRLVSDTTTEKVKPESSSSFGGVGTDTRENLSHKIFFALKGDRYDAHDYLESAVTAGASALVVHDLRKVPAQIDKQIVVIEVADTLKALQDLAAYWRKLYPFKVLGITGSNGKTTCKEFTSSLLKTSFKTHSSKGSFNNHWGVPLTLLGAHPEEQIIVAEMGMNHQGELTELNKIAQPDIVLCTTVGRAHLGHFKDVFEIADAKNEIYESAPEKAQAIFNIDHARTLEMLEKWKANRPASKFYTYSVHLEWADVYLHLKRHHEGGLDISGHINGLKGSAQVPVFGEHNVQNLAASCALSLAAGMTAEKIWESLPKCESAWGRNQWLRTKKGQNVLFDAYNANPESMNALFENLKSLNSLKTKVGVIGEMREMGPQSELVHEEIGFKAGSVGFKAIVYVGQYFESFEKGIKKSKSDTRLVHVMKASEATLALDNEIRSDELVVMKASRGIGLEKTISPLIEGGFFKP